MALPEFNEVGDLPPGVHQAPLNEVVERFGVTQGQRGLCTRRLLHIYALAQLTGHIQHLLGAAGVTDRREP
jgi:hypothetical protein